MLPTIPSIRRRTNPGSGRALGQSPGQHLGALSLLAGLLLAGLGSGPAMGRDLPSENLRRESVSAPSQLRAAPLSPTRIRLAWQDNSCREADQKLEVFLGGRWVEVPFSLGADTTSLIVTGLSASTDYRFRITASNPEGDSFPSRAVDARTFVAGVACRPGRFRLCLLDGRYRVDVAFEIEPGTGFTRQARAVPNTDRGGLFWFFEPQNLELAVEMLTLPASVPASATAAVGTQPDPTTDFEVGIRFGGLTDRAYRMVVTDTLTGEARELVNPPGGRCGFFERRLFARAGWASQLSDEQEPADQRLASSGRAMGSRPAPPHALDRLEIDLRPIFTAQDPDDAPSARAATRAESSCGRDDQALELGSARFEARLRWSDPIADGLAATALDGTNATGFFVVEEGSHPEWAIKVLDGRAINGHFWLFSAPLGPLGGRLTVFDRETGKTSVIDHPPESLCMLTRFSDLP